MELFSTIEHLKRLLGMKEFNTDNLSISAIELFQKTTGIKSLNFIDKKIEDSLNNNSKLIEKLMHDF